MSDLSLAHFFIDQSLEKPYAPCVGRLALHCRAVVAEDMSTCLSSSKKNARKSQQKTRCKLFNKQRHKDYSKVYPRPQLNLNQNTSRHQFKPN